MKAREIGAAPRASARMRQCAQPLADARGAAQNFSPHSHICREIV